VLINDETGRLHTHYVQTGTATGRLSSKDPNLQNIPIREAEGRKIRSAFTAPEGCTFLSADYSQIELVVLAELSGDPILQEAFRSGKDVHGQTAALLFGTDEASVTPQMRAIGKTINFGVIYGMSAFRLARDMRIPRAEAELFINTYFERYSGVRGFIDRTIREAENRGYVETLSGRQRTVPRIGSSNRTEKRAEERIAVNTSIQGSAADIIKRAMIDIFAALKGMRSRLILQIHDELLLEVALDERDEVRRLVRTAMEGAADLTRLTYRPYALEVFGARETTPRLTGLEIDGAPRLLFSREDITHALLDQPCWGVSGYTSDNARRLMTNIVLSAITAGRE
jgi:DNA polymerase-1